MSEVTLEWVKAQAELAGLPLTEDEAKALIPGITRNRAQAQIARSFLTEHETPPSATFDPQIGKEG
jgi:hypothetical protein